MVAGLQYKKWPLGIMQGRLVPRLKGRYQAFPVNYWQAEFHIARELGFHFIEFILDYDKAEANPLLTKEGLAQVQDLVQTTGVGVRSICGDYFMEAPFHSQHQIKSEQVLERLLQSAASLKARDVVIPCVDQSKLKTPGDVEKVVESVNKFIPVIEKLNLFLNFETDLNPEEFSAFLSNFKSPHIKVNYDIGNSASLGYSATEEFEAYGSKISNVHIKDRVLGGSSIKLGDGNAKFDEVFGLLKQINFNGIFTMQASRHPEFVSEIPWVAEQKVFAEKYIEKYL
jgi:sugar phosphate isomerase/epimerase